VKKYSYFHFCSATDQ